MSYLIIFRNSWNSHQERNLQHGEWNRKDRGENTAELRRCYEEACAELSSERGQHTEDLIVQTRFSGLAGAP